MTAKSMGVLFLCFSLLSGMGSSASLGQAPADVCYSTPVPADCAAPLLRHLLARIDGSAEPNKVELRSALVDKLINQGYLDSGLMAARAMDESPEKGRKLLVIGTLYANQRGFAKAREIEKLLLDPQDKRLLLTAIVRRFVLDGEVEPAWQLVKEANDETLSDSFQAALVNQFAFEQRFVLAWQALWEIKTASARHQALSELAFVQLPSQTLSDVLRSVAAIDDPALRVEVYAQLGHYGHNLKMPQASDRLFAEALEDLQQLDKSGTGDMDSLRRTLASMLETSRKTDTARVIAEGIRDLNQRLISLSQVASRLAEQGERGKAKALFQKNVAATSGLTDPRLRAEALSWQAQTMMSAGLPEEAIAVLARIDNALQRNTTHQALGRIALTQGKYEFAEEIFNSIVSERHRLIGLMWTATLAIGVDDRRNQARRLADSTQAALEMDALEGFNEILSHLINVRLMLRQYEQVRALNSWQEDADDRFRTLAKLGAAAIDSGDNKTALESLEERLDLLVSGQSAWDYARIAQVALSVPLNYKPAEIITLSKRLKDPNKTQLFLSVVATTLAERNHLDEARTVIKLAADPVLKEDFELPELAALLFQSLVAD